MPLDNRYEEQLKIFDRLRDRLKAVLKRFGEPDLLQRNGDYSVSGDYWGYPQVRVSIHNLVLLKPPIIELLRRQCSEFSGWELVVAVAIRGHYHDWPDMGLIIRAHEIVDGLQRQYFPQEFQNIRYADSRPGTDLD